MTAPQGTKFKSNIQIPVEEPLYSIDDIMELYGLDQWTIRMWIDRFEIQGYLSTADGGMLFTRRAAEQIGVICRLMKKRMKLKEIREYLGSGSGLEEI